MEPAAADQVAGTQHRDRKEITDVQLDPAPPISVTEESIEVIASPAQNTDIGNAEGGKHHQALVGIGTRAHRDGRAAELRPTQSLP